MGNSPVPSPVTPRPTTPPTPLFTSAAFNIPPVGVEYGTAFLFQCPINGFVNRVSGMSSLGVDKFQAYCSNGFTRIFGNSSSLMSFDSTEVDGGFRRMDAGVSNLEVIGMLAAFKLYNTANAQVVGSVSRNTSVVMDCGIGNRIVGFHGFAKTFVYQIGPVCETSERPTQTPSRKPAPTPSRKPTTFPTPILIALSLGSASQVSTNQMGSGAANAIDGNTATYSQTFSQPQAWWKAKLLQPGAAVMKVVITPLAGYSDRVSNIQVRVGGSDSGNGNFSANALCGTFGTATNNLQIVIICPSLLLGPYLSIQLIGAYFLTMSEVQVFGRGIISSEKPTIKPSRVPSRKTITPKAFTVKSTVKPPAPAPKGFTVKSTVKPPAPAPKGFTVKSTAKQPVSAPKAFTVKSTVKPPAPAPKGFTVKSTAKQPVSAPKAFTVKSTVKPPAPAPKGLTVKSTVKPPAVAPKGFTVKSTVKPPASAPKGFTVKSTAKQPAPAPKAFTVKATVKPPAPAPKGFTVKFTVKPPAAAQKAFTVKSTVKPPAAAPKGYTVKSTAKPPAPAPKGFTVKSTVKPPASAPKGFTVKSTVKPPALAPKGFTVKSTAKQPAPGAFRYTTKPNLTRTLKITSKSATGAFTYTSRPNLQRILKVSSKSAAGAFSYTAKPNLTRTLKITSRSAAGAFTYTSKPNLQRILKVSSKSAAGTSEPMSSSLPTGAVAACMVMLVGAAVWTYKKKRAQKKTPNASAQKDGLDAALVNEAKLEQGPRDVHSMLLLV